MIAIDEYELVTESAGLVERPGRALFEVSGGEAADFLQGQVSNDVEALAAGEGCYATLLNHKGKIRTDMRVLRTAGGFVLDTESFAHRVIEHMLETYSLGRDVHFRDLSRKRRLASLIGPRARERLDVAPPELEHASVEGDHGLYVATDLGVDVICAAEDAAAVREALGVEPVSDEAAECLRIESGRPRFSIDVGTDTIPEEAGLNERAVSFTKGCYVGQETVARLHYKGRPNRHLRGLRATEPVERGAEIRLGDRVVGEVGSTAVSPALGPIALAVVRREADPGAVVQVGASSVEATVSELPFTA